MTNPMTNPPPVAPVVTDEMVEFAYSAWRSSLHNILPEDQCVQDHYKAMRAAITAALIASGELERLRTAAKLALDAFYKCVEWSGTTDFDHEIAALEAALDKLTGEKFDEYYADDYDVWDKDYLGDLYYSIDYEYLNEGLEDDEDICNG